MFKRHKTPIALALICIFAGAALLTSADGQDTKPQKPAAKPDTRPTDAKKEEARRHS